jgi:hypothetical protein
VATGVCAESATGVSTGKKIMEANLTPVVLELISNNVELRDQRGCMSG